MLYRKFSALCFLLKLGKQLETAVLLSHLKTSNIFLVAVLLYLTHFCLIICLCPLFVKHGESTFLAPTGDRSRSYKITLLYTPISLLPLLLGARVTARQCQESLLLGKPAEPGRTSIMHGAKHFIGVQTVLQVLQAERLSLSHPLRSYL